MKLLQRLALIALVVIGTECLPPVLAQGETIPDAVARGAKGRIRSQPSGPVPAMRDLLVTADLVVRGTIADSVSYLSADKRDVYTDHMLTNTTIMYQSSIPSSPQPSPPTSLFVTQLGGSVTLGEATYTQVEDGLPLLNRGTEALFIAVRRDGKYHLAQVFYGAFEISKGSFKPLAGRADFAAEFKDVPAATALADIRKRIEEARSPVR